ncbi:MAG TPA: hypothetical protein VF690_06875 [Hymenobacter sp.]|jgi:hypothetical protein
MSYSTSNAMNHWRIYQHIGSVAAHATATLAHIVKLYSPYTHANEAQAALRKRALAELDRRAAAGREDAKQVLREYMGPTPKRRTTSWEETSGIDPNTGYSL